MSHLPYSVATAVHRDHVPWSSLSLLTGLSGAPSSSLAGSLALDQFTDEATRGVPALQTLAGEELMLCSLNY